MSLFFSLVPISPPFLPDMPPLSLSLFHTHTHAHTHSLSLPHSPTTTRPNMNFWQEPGSLFNCQCYRECPHKSNVVMPLKRLLALAITDTHTHTHTNNLFLTFSHFLPRTPETHAQSLAQMWCVRMRALRLFALASDTAAPVFVCNFHWLRSTPPNPWEFVDQHLLKKLLGVGVYNWAEKKRVQWVQRGRLFLCGIFLMYSV